MNAIQFIKEKGVDKARKVVEGAPDRATTVKPSLDFKHFMYGICENAGGAYILLSDLKRLVESADLINSLDDRIQQDLRPEDIEEEFDALPEETKQKFYDLVSDTLDGFLWCNRVWEAWYVGTMSQDDFSPAGDDPDVIHRHAVAAYKLHKELK